MHTKNVGKGPPNGYIHKNRKHNLGQHDANFDFFFLLALGVWE